MLHLEVVTPVALDLLRGVQQDPVFAQTRLVGGTALALQIGHRRSIDLDIFGHLDLSPFEVEQELRVYGATSVRNRSKRIQGYMVSGVQVDLVEYDYPWLDAPIMGEGLRLASCRDIAAMKLAAITNRGTKKDFVDLRFLLETFELAEMLDFYARKFADGALFPVLKNLVFFDDADEDPMPNMLKACDWQAAKQRIADAVSVLSVGQTSALPPVP